MAVLQRLIDMPAREARLRALVAGKTLFRPFPLDRLQRARYQRPLGKAHPDEIAALDAEPRPLPVEQETRLRRVALAEQQPVDTFLAAESSSTSIAATKLRSILSTSIGSRWSNAIEV